MAKVKITYPDGAVYEVGEISFEQVQTLIHRNGTSPKRPTQKTFDLRSLDSPDYKGFWSAITEKARDFLLLVSCSPDGISADDVAEALSFDSPMRLGGVTGGGIAKLAPKFGLKVADLYQKSVSRDKGKRIVLYKSGKETANLPLK